MPFVKLDSKAVDELFAPPAEKKTGKSEEWQRIRAEFKAIIQDIPVGEGGKWTLSEGEDKATIRTRLTNAATELNLALDFKRSRDREITFRVIPKSDKPKQVRKKKTE